MTQYTLAPGYPEVVADPSQAAGNRTTMWHLAMPVEEPSTALGPDSLASENRSRRQVLLPFLLDHALGSPTGVADII